MKYRYSGFINLIQVLGDLLVLNAAFVVAHWAVEGANPLSSYYHSTQLLLFCNIAWLILFGLNKTYHIGRTEKIAHTLSRHLFLILIHFLLLAGHQLVIAGYDRLSLSLLCTYLLFILAELSWKTAYLLALQRYRSRGYNFRNVVVVGYGDLAEELKTYFRFHPEFGYRFLGFFDNEHSRENILGSIDALFQFVKLNKVDEIYCCLPYVEYRRVKALIDLGEENLIKVKLITDFRGFSLKGLQLERYDHIPVLNVSRIPLDNAFNQLMKRLFDIIFSSLVILLLFSWLFPLIALCIKLESPGPVFFRQKRSGLRNKTFWCYKFRSMRLNTESDTLQASRHDSRITRVGAFLRKTSLDELPQFFNVFLGNMSVVGPRPHMLSHTEAYSQQITKFMARHFVKPGITGLAQAKGYRGETETIGMMKDRIRLDRFYVSNWSILFDLRIIFLTIQSLLMGQEKAY